VDKPATQLSGSLIWQFHHADEPGLELGMSAGRVRLLAIALVVMVGCPAAVACAKSGPITFYFGLKRPDATAQKAFFAVSWPGSSTYRHFLNLKQVSARYGATRAVRRAFVGQIKRLGIRMRCWFACRQRRRHAFPTPPRRSHSAPIAAAAVA
jgi:hypothetical protein